MTLAVFHASADVEAHVAPLRRARRFRLTCCPQARPNSITRPKRPYDGVLWELAPGGRPDRRRVAQLARVAPVVSYSVDGGRELADLSRASGFASHLTAPLSPLAVEHQMMLASPGDLATRMARFSRALGRHLRRVEVLAAFVGELRTTADPRSVAELLVSQAVQWVPAPSLAVVAAVGLGDSRLLAGRALAPVLETSAHAVADWVVEHGEEFCSARLDQDARLPDGAAVAALALPLLDGARAVGALVALDRAPSKVPPRIPAATRDLLGLYLAPAGHALEAARHVAQLEELSVTDDLTRLYNSRYLSQALRRESKRSTRSGRPLSLLFIDLDGFKLVNDAHGHLAGSRALVEAAAVIRGSARETDIVARFGGDEFAVVLPDTGADGAIAVGERVRERIAEHAFLAEAGLDVRLTASVGVATLAQEVGTSEALVQAADLAMYWVKEHGKNGIHFATG